MKLSNVQTRTSSDALSAAGSITVTQTTWERQLEPLDWPRWLLCRLHFIHHPHCHAYSGYAWVWREAPATRDARQRRRFLGVGSRPMHYLDPRDWFFYFILDCNRCSRPDCLNYGDC